jgi:hypothetical protein
MTMADLGEMLDRAWRDLGFQQAVPDVRITAVIEAYVRQATDLALACLEAPSQGRPALEQQRKRLDHALDVITGRAVKVSWERRPQ